MIIDSDIDASWRSCLAVWAKRGRVEDLPRHIRKPSYTPDEGKRLGTQFAKAFKDQYPFIVERLGSSDSVETLCAFEILEMICWEYYINNVPEDLLELNVAIPAQIAKELPYAGLDLYGTAFPGETIGDLFKAVFIDADLEDTDFDDP